MNPCRSGIGLDLQPVSVLLQHIDRWRRHPAHDVTGAIVVLKILGIRNP